MGLVCGAGFCKPGLGTERIEDANFKRGREVQSAGVITFAHSAVKTWKEKIGGK